jgi:hypothetical protein
MNHNNYTDENSNKVIVNDKIENSYQFKYVTHKTLEGNIKYFRVTAIETGSLKCSSESWMDYMRNIYVENVDIGEGQFICQDENGLFQIWDNIKCCYVDYLGYDKETDKDRLELYFWINKEKYSKPNIGITIKMFLETLVLKRDYMSWNIVSCC